MYIYIYTSIINISVVISIIIINSSRLFESLLNHPMNIQIYIYICNISLCTIIYIYIYMYISNKLKYIVCADLAVAAEQPDGEVLGGDR